MRREPVSPEGPRGDRARIDLRTPLRLRSAFAFPLQTREARKEVLIGAALLLLPGIGWLLNMGHRIQMVHNMRAGIPPWPSWRGYGRLLGHGTITFLGMVEYYLPALAVGLLAGRRDSAALLVAAALLGAGATVAIPGYMSHYCRRFDARGMFDPARALRGVRQGGRAYWRAWGDRARRPGGLLSRAPRPGTGVPGDERLVLAGRGVQLRHGVHAALRPVREDARGGA